MKLNILNNLTLKLVNCYYLVCIYLLFNIVTLCLTQEFGVPLLPILQEGHFQGQSANSVGTTKGASTPGLGAKGVLAPTGPGALMNIPNPSNDTRVQSLIKHRDVLDKIQMKTKFDSAIKIHSVISAHTQIVSGVITYLGLRVVKTRCRVGASSPPAECQQDHSEPALVCEIAVWQRPWLNSTKVIDEKSKCAKVEKSNSFVNWGQAGSNHETVPEDFITVGSLPTSLDEKQFALEGFEYVNRGSNSKFKGVLADYQISDIMFSPSVNATKAVVSIEYGYTLCLKFLHKMLDDRICPLDLDRQNYVCRVTVLSNPKLTTSLKVLPSNSQDILCKIKDSSVQASVIVPVKEVCSGCLQSQSLNDPSVLKAAEFALFEHDRRSDDRELHKMVKLHKAEKQVVGGIKYFITMELADTECLKPLSAINIDRTLCRQSLLDDTDVCDVVVFERPWQNIMELVSAKCFDRHEYRGLDSRIQQTVGKSSLRAGSGLLNASPAFRTQGTNHPHVSQPPPSPSPPLSPSDPVSESIRFVVNEFNIRESDDYDDGLYKLVRVIDFDTKNEISGPVDHITIELAETICTRLNAPVDDCPLRIGEDNEICSASVLRAQPLRLIRLTCDDTDDYYRLTANPRVQPFSTSNQLLFAETPREGHGSASVSVPLPSNDSSVADLARFIVAQYNLRAEDDDVYKLNSVVNSYMQSSGSSTIYFVELEMVETLCKKYQPVVDVSRCPKDPTERPEICQAQVSVSHSVGGRARTTKTLNRMFCDERRSFYVRKIKRRLGKVGAGAGVPQGTWLKEDLSGDKASRFGRLVADEFDFRSDEDNIFVLVKVLSSETENSGLTHRLRVELAETICPKYKPSIKKSRCNIDIGEEHKFCDAVVEQRPWRHDEVVTSLACREREDSRESPDGSEEVFYARVRPSAHSRPRFLRSRYRIRVHSRESDESNEKYYRATSRSPILLRDSDERGLLDFDDDLFEPSRRHPLTRFEDDDDRDSDHLLDSRSIETYYSGFRTKRKSIPGGWTPVTNETKANESASFALSHLDSSADGEYLRKVVRVINATSQVVSGIKIQVTFEVVMTTCLKDQLSNDTSLSTDCPAQPDSPSFLCTATIWEQVWLGRQEVLESNCTEIVSSDNHEIAQPI